MHISLDGFVAGPNGEMNWIKVDEEIFDHVGKRVGQTDTALYGRVTYDMMEGYWPTAADKPNPSGMIFNIQNGIATLTKLFYQKH
jgi:dihydrofolate reductase